MFDVLKLLGSLAETSAAPSGANRFGSAVQGSGGPLQTLLGQLAGSGAPSGGLGSLLGGLLGQGGSTESARGGPMPDRLGPSLASSTGTRGSTESNERQKPGDLLAAGGLGGLAGALLGGGRGAMGGGVMAVLGSLAYQALLAHRDAGANPTAATLAGTPQQPVQAASFGLPFSGDAAEAQRRALLVVRAMVQAAKADGRIDAREMQLITQKLDEHGQDSTARDFVMAEMRKPIDIGSLVRDVRSPQEAAEVYAASLIAIEVDDPAERDYLADLAAALSLPPAVVGRINSALGVQA